jgi:hypothetical protein
VDPGVPDGLAVVAKGGEAEKRRETPDLEKKKNKF